MRKKVQEKDIVEIFPQVFGKIIVNLAQSVIIGIANQFAECDNFDDAECILNQIAGQEIEEGKGDVSNAGKKGRI